MHIKNLKVVNGDSGKQAQQILNDWQKAGIIKAELALRLKMLLKGTNLDTDSFMPVGATDGTINMDTRVQARSLTGQRDGVQQFNAGTYITGAGYELVKSSKIIALLSGISAAPVCADICASGVIAAIIAPTADKVIPIQDFVTTLRAYFEAHKMASNAVSTRNRLNAGNVREGVVTTLTAGATGFKTMVGIHAEFPVISSFFSKLSLTAIPDSMDAVKLLAGLPPHVRGQVFQKLDAGLIGQDVFTVSITIQDVQKTLKVVGYNTTTNGNTKTTDAKRNVDTGALFARPTVQQTSQPN